MGDKGKIVFKIEYYYEKSQVRKTERYDTKSEAKARYDALLFDPQCSSIILVEIFVLEAHDKPVLWKPSLFGDI